MKREKKKEKNDENKNNTGNDRKTKSLGVRVLKKCAKIGGIILAVGVSIYAVAHVSADFRKTMYGPDGFWTKIGDKAHIFVVEGTEAAEERMEAERQEVAALADAQKLVDLGAPEVDANTIKFYNSDSSDASLRTQKRTDNEAAFSFVQFQGNPDLHYNVEVKTSEGKTVTFDVVGDDYLTTANGEYTLMITNDKTGSGSITNVNIITYGNKLEGEGKNVKAVIDTEKTSATVSATNPKAGIKEGGDKEIDLDNLDNDGDIIVKYGKTSESKDTPAPETNPSKEEEKKAEAPSQEREITLDNTDVQPGV